MGLVGSDRSCTLRRTLLALIASAATIAAPRVAAAMPAAGGGEPANPTVSDSTGAASFRIPIAVPPGPGGFAPDLALSYSSRAGDGAFGVGWSLGLPEIRCSARFGVPDFASCQDYELGDTLLVAGAEAGRYHTVVESFQRIRFFSSSNSWTVEQPNGVKLFFGGPTTHRISQGGHTARWLLQSMEDAFGNEIFFEHDRSDTGEAVPSSITYGAGAAPGQGPREIQFLYETRTDPRLEFSDGIERHLDRRLREIQVVSNGGIFRRYAFGYDLAGVTYTTGRSRLSWVQEFGTDCTTADPIQGCAGLGLPRRTFRYRDALDVSPQFSSNGAYRVPFGNYVTSVSHGLRNSFPAQIGDLDGDGLPDRIEVHAPENYSLAGFRIWINTGSGFTSSGPIAATYRQSFANLRYQKPYWEYQQIPAPIASQPYGWNPSMFAMCSVIPKSREAILSQELVTRGLSAKTSSVAALRASNGNPSDGFFEPRPSFRLADLDADGLADLVVSTRLSGLTRHFDCSTGQPLTTPVSFPAQTVTVVFRNTGSGWVDDAAARALATGLPPFEEAIVKSTYQTEIDEPSQYLFWDGDGHAQSPCANRSIWGFEQLFSRAEDQTAVCQNFIDLAPEFVDFNGDGYPDLAVLERDHPDSFGTGVDDDYGLWHNPARTHVWIQKPGAAPRWQRAPQYDLPSAAWPQGPWIAGLAHAGLQHYLEGAAPWYGACASWRPQPEFELCSPNTYRSDIGVRLADLNRDGLADVVWSSPHGPSPGAFLNTGAGSPGDPSSAWCASEPDDVAYVGSACPEAAAYRPPALLAKYSGDSNLWVSAGQLADFNGDGFLDFISIDPILRATNSWPTWIHDPSVSAASVWKREGRFDVIFTCQCTINQNGPPTGCTAPDPNWGNPICVDSPRFEALDINGDGADDVVGDTKAFLSQSRHSDLIRTVENGRGGSVAVEYASMNLQRDASLEADADAVAWADDAGPVMLWRPAAVVSRVQVTGPNLAPPGAVTDYRYAHLRFSSELRSDLGFGLVQRTRAGGSVEEYFYQDLGRTGRTARRLVKDAGAVVHRYQATWEHVPGVIPGSTAGVYLARLVAEHTNNEYENGVSGALLTRSFLYDDAFGYNFLTQIHTVRASTETIRILLPEAADLNRWIIGLVRERRDADQRSTWESRSELTYTGEGRLATELRHRLRGDGSDPVTDLTQYSYDDYGNLRSRIDPNGHVTELGYDEGQSVLTSRTDPAVDGQPAKVTLFTPHPVFGVPSAINPGYRDIPRSELVLDAFGRVTETWWIPRGSRGEGERVLVSATNFEDHASPPYVEQFQYANADRDAIRTAVVDDGFGGVWKTIRDAGAMGLGGTGVLRFMGSATYHDPAQRISRTTYDLPCGSNASGGMDDLCRSLTGASENPATVTRRDALGRPIRIDTPRGALLSHYTFSLEQVVEGHTRNSNWVDVVWSQNAKGDLTRRSFDADRVLAVAECTNSDPNRASLADASCARDDGPNRTLYGYHASGQLEVVHDPLGVDGLWGNPRHQLRYHFDTAGQVIAIDDPDAGHSETFYDGAGNVVKTINARGQQRVTQYDPLDRPTRIAAPEGNIVFGYRAEELQLKTESGSGYRYRKTFTYDGFGRRSGESRTGLAAQGAGYSYDLLGRRTAIIANGTIVRYEYEGAFLRRVCAVDSSVPCSDPTANQRIITGVEYDELGRRSAVRMPGGVRSYTYDERDEVDTRDLREDQFVGASTLTYDYPTRDPLGNVLTWSTAAPPNAGLNASGSYTYDARSRLATWSRTPAGQSEQTESFDYDALGNLVSHAGVAQVFEHPTKPHALTSRGTKTYAYDDSGNLARAGSRHFTFDSADRLVCVGSAAGGCDVLRVVYDAGGERIFEQAGATKRGFLGPDMVRTRSSGGDEYRLDILAFGERVAYTISQPTPASASLRVFSFEVPPSLMGLFPAAALAWCLGLAIRGGLLVGVARRPGHATLSGVLIVSLVIPYPAVAGGGSTAWTRIYRWVLSDPLGSAVAVLDETGLLLHHTRFKPFGAVEGEYQAASDPQHRRFFAGHPQQEETGLHYMNARWMDPETGTFLSVDPVVANASDPQSLNAYAYARNNPVNLTDPNGMCVNMFACGMILPAYGFGNLTTITTTSTLKFADKAGNVISSSSMTWTTYSVNGAWAGSASSGVWFGGDGGTQSSQSSVTSGASGISSPGAGSFGLIGRAASAVGGALARVGSILGWDLALAFQGLVGNLYGLTRGLLTALAGLATLNASMIGNGLSQTFWALVPRFGFWSGPGWGQPNFKANGGSWYGPYSSQNVIEEATYQHDQDHQKPGADRALISDVWSRHDLGPYGQVYRVGLTALFGAGIGLGLDD